MKLSLEVAVSVPTGLLLLWLLLLLLLLLLLAIKSRISSRPDKELCLERGRLPAGLFEGARTGEAEDEFEGEPSSGSSSVLRVASASLSMSILILLPCLLNSFNGFPPKLGRLVIAESSVIDILLWSPCSGLNSEIAAAGSGTALLVSLASLTEEVDPENADENDEAEEEDEVRLSEGRLILSRLVLTNALSEEVFEVTETAGIPDI